jgi:hypothetical protein
MRLFRAGDAAPLHATLDNISGGGLFFKSATPISDGERLTSEIMLPIKTPPYGQAALLKCDLVVMRSESGDSGYGIGCQFSHYSVQLPRYKLASAGTHSARVITGEERARV